MTGRRRTQLFGRCRARYSEAEEEMTIDKFMEELRWYWSWLYDDCLSRLYEQHFLRLHDREWAQWELVTLAGVLSILLFLKVRRRRRKMAARIARLARGVEEPGMVNVKLAGGNGYRRNGEDLHEYLLRSGPELHREHHRWSTGMEIAELSDQPVRQLRREIIKRDQSEARLEREVTELSIANERLQREVAESMRAEERLERKFVELAAANERLQRKSVSAGRVEEPVMG
jgi:hypothetical protein